MLFLLGGFFIPGMSGDPPSDPPPPPGGHGEGTNQPPAGAPIEGGWGILIVLGSVFAGVRYYRTRAEH